MSPQQGRVGAGRDHGRRAFNVFKDEPDQRVTLRFHRSTVAEIEQRIDDGQYNSRSELIRKAVAELLEGEKPRGDSA